MKKFAALPLLALAAACTAAPPPAEVSAAAQSQLAEALKGRVQAGPPLNCVSQRDLRGNRSAGEEAIIFATRGSDLVYVNRPTAGCPELGSGRALRIRTPSTQYCAGEIVEVIDTLNNVTYGSCSLGQFTPYRRGR